MRALSIRMITFGDRSGMGGFGAMRNFGERKSASSGNPYRRGIAAIGRSRLVKGAITGPSVEIGKIRI
jgi:hypothetical protein